MYHGEVSVAQDQLTTFLQVAEDLQVKGMMRLQSSNRYSWKMPFLFPLYNNQMETDRLNLIVKF